jgi:trans-2,3-dihydro-3-hydroxyanthranilate isomerase
MQLYLVDVFAEAKYAGNQLAVVRGAAGLTSEQMQTLALEMGFSETTFILSDAMRDGGYDVRIFTVEHEMPFAGHPTLGTAWVIHQHIRHADIVTLNLKVGQIPVTFASGADGVLWMQQKPPTFFETYAPDIIAEAVGLSADDIDPRYPVQRVSTGVAFVIVPLKTRDAIKRAKVQRETFDRLLGYDALDVYLFCPEPYDVAHHLNARMFWSDGEDAATGSAAGCLTAYLVEHGCFGASVDIRVEQGVEIRRPSLLYLRGSRDADGTISVRVGGRVQAVAVGELV